MANSIAITYLGQEGFLFQHDGISVAIDPYLSYSGDLAPGSPENFWRRNYPPPVLPSEMVNVDLVLCTHDHLDHTDPETLLGIADASPRCDFAGPRSSVATMIRAGLSPDRVRTLNAGEPFSFGGATIHPIAAAHEEYERDAGGYHRYLGYVLVWNGITIYHAGDTIPTDQLRTDVGRFEIDLGFLPINGRDAARRELGIVGNMTCEEAAEFATSQGFGMAVPMHYDLYSNNGGSLSEFVAFLEQKGQAFKAFAPGEQIIHPFPKR